MTNQYWEFVNQNRDTQSSMKDGTNAFARVNFTFGSNFVNCSSNIPRESGRFEPLPCVKYFPVGFKILIECSKIERIKFHTSPVGVSVIQFKQNRLIYKF